MTRTMASDEPPERPAQLALPGLSPVPPASPADRPAERPGLLDLGDEGDEGPVWSALEFTKRFEDR